MPQVMSRSRGTARPTQAPEAREGAEASEIRQVIDGLLVPPAAPLARDCAEARCGRDARPASPARDVAVHNACLLVFEPWCRSVPERERRFRPGLAPEEIRTHLMPVITETVLPTLSARLGADERPCALAAPPHAAEADAEAERETACAERLYAAILSGGQRDALDAVRDLTDAGADGVERVLCLVMPAVADRLETACREETCSQAERTVGMCMLRSLVDRLEGETAPAAAGGADAPVVLLWAPSGDPLGFDLSLLAHLLRRSGVVVETHEGAAPGSVVSEVSRGGTDAVVVSAASRGGGGTAVGLAEAITAEDCGCEVVGLGEPVRAARDEDSRAHDAPTRLAASAGEVCALLHETVVRGRAALGGPLCPAPCRARRRGAH